MVRYIVLLIFLFVFNGSLFSQEKTVYKIINSNQLIVGSDTLKVGISKLQDHFSQKQIDSLGIPSETQWDGDCDSGSYRSYLIKNKAYKLIYNSESEEEFCLDRIEIKLNDDINVSLGDTLLFDYRSHIGLPILGSLEIINDYYSLDSTFWYKQEGLAVKIYKNNNDVRILSMDLHPKHWDQDLKRKRLNGEIKNQIGEPIPAVVLLAYDKLDSLKYFGTTSIDGKFYFDVDAVKNIDVFRFNYHQQTVKVVDNKDQTINFELKKKIYFLPDILVTRRGEVEIDSICYLDQFPKVRDVSKINVWLWCDFTDYNPLAYNIPSAIGGLKNSCEKLVTSLSQKKKLRKCTAEVYLTIDKNGHTKIDNILCDDKINEEYLARYIIENLTWVPVKWRGKPLGSNWSMKIIFE